MAQNGDTITYTYSDGKSVAEDVSDVGEVVVEYCDGAGGESNAASGGSGGRVENSTIDVSNESTIYIWVGTYTFPTDDSYNTGRYADTDSVNGSTEISLFDTGENDSDDEPFLVASGAGGDGGGGSSGDGGHAGARGGAAGAGDVLGVSGVSDSSTSPPAGGDGGNAGDPAEAGGDGDGAIDDQNRGLVSGGTTIKGGGSPSDTDGEIQITYKSSAPSAPSNVQITDAQTEDELTLDWDLVDNATGYYVYRAEASGTSKSDYTQVADVTGPPYTDTGLEDGEQYYYRVSSHD